MHDNARKFVASIASRLPAMTVAEIGSRNVNGSVRYLFDGFYVGVDLVSGPGVDIVADGATWDGDGRTYDCIVCCEVLEHAANAGEICRNIGRLLNNGGMAIITVAGPNRKPHSAVDGGPLREGEYYANVLPDDIRNWFPGCRVLTQTTDDYEDVYALVLMD